ncbi:hypothetical protein M0765_000745 [Variovorax sp. S2]|uniref:hypothetical protein n=1 Tax=Variovorax sp. S12S4 TaxID=3029170 RepID=UPI00215C75AC|nr:hypothetical protein [Variovorax sp. S12S4]MCR8956307.1 hypothetical protein [Variovorax sp. S12S4]
MAKKPLKLCPLAQHIVKMLAESDRPGHGPTYAVGKAHELHGQTTNEVLVWASRSLDGRNRSDLADLLRGASSEDVDAGDLVAVARVEKAIRALPALDLKELLS